MSKPSLPDFVSDDTFTPAAQPEAEAQTAPAAEAPAEETAAPSGPIRGPDGKFASAQAPAEAAPQAEAPQAPAPDVQPLQSPEPQLTEQAAGILRALMDEREGRREERAAREAAEKRAKELETWREQQLAQANRQPPPDPDQDPVGFRNFQAQQLDQVFWDQRLEMSKQFAEIRHGAETVNTAFQWGVERCDADPYFNAKVRSSKDPVGFVVSEYQREQLVSALSPEDVEAFRQWKAAQQAASAAPPATSVAPQLTAAHPAAPPAQPAPPRPSLAAAPSAANSAAPIPRDGEATYRQMFG